MAIETQEEFACLYSIMEAAWAFLDSLEVTIETGDSQEIATAKIDHFLSGAWVAGACDYLDEVLEKHWHDFY